eukprot:s1334_g11.t1
MVLLHILSDSSVTFGTSSVSPVVAAISLFCGFCVGFEDNSRSNSFAQVSLAMGCSPAECAEAQGLLSEASASLAERMECFIAWCDLLLRVVSTFGSFLVGMIIEGPIAQRNAPRRLLSDTSLAAMGKVHGSLARAGKVKNQTPKVAKAEKKKKLTGRAKKRFVYNRRFVSVVKSGPKRGPNSNAGKYRCSGDSTSPKMCDERERKIPEWCNIFAPSWQSMVAAAPPMSAVEGQDTDMVKGEPLELRASARYGRPSPPQGLWVLTILTFATSSFATYRAAQWVADEFLTSREYDPYLAQKLKHYPLVLVVVLSLVPIGLAFNSAYFAPIFYHRAWLPSRHGVYDQSLSPPSMQRVDQRLKMRHERITVESTARTLR